MFNSQSDLLITLSSHAPILCKARINSTFRTNECCIKSNWTLIDLKRKDKTTYQQVHVFSIPEHRSKYLDISFISEPIYTSHGEGFPFVSESGVRKLWDILHDLGQMRAICLEYNLPSSSINAAEVTKVACSKVGRFIQIWNNEFISRTIELSCTNSNKLHGRIFPAKDSFFHGVAWSKDTNHIAYLAEDTRESKLQVNSDHPSKDEVGEKVFVHHEDWGEALTDTVRPILCILNITNEEIRIAPSEYGSIKLCANEPLWCPNDKGIVFVGYNLESYNLGAIYCTQRASQLFYWNMIDDNLIALSEPGYSVRCPRFSPDGSYLVWLQNKASGPHNQCTSLVGLSWPASFAKPPDIIVPIVTCPTNDIDNFPGLYCDLSERCWSKDSSYIVVSSCWGFYSVPLLIQIKRAFNECDSGNRVIPLSTNCVLNSEVQINYSEFKILDFFHDIVVAAVNSPLHPPSLVILNLNQVNMEASENKVELLRWFILPSKNRLLGERSISCIKGADWFVEKIKTADGSGHFECMLFKPVIEADGSVISLDISNFCATNDIDRLTGKKFNGLIVIPHGGPHSCSTACWSVYTAGFVCSGFAVLLVNYRGSLGYGNGFVYELLGHIGTKDVSDCVQATQFALEHLKQFVADPKAFLFGGSHGGFLTLHLSGRHQNLYTASVARNPVTNLTSMIDTSDIPDWCFTEIGLGDKWSYDCIPSVDDLSLFHQASPIRFITDKWSVPLLICLGSKDRRVPISQGLTFYRKLKAHKPKLPCELLLYPYDKHSLDSPATLLDVFVHVMDWFSR